MKAIMRFAVVAVAICSWFAISNHCAFAALATKTAAASHGCPFHTKPKEKQSTDAQCCKILRAVPSVPSKNWARDDGKFSATDIYWSEWTRIVAYSRTTLVPLLLDTGPPDAHSFAELILHRSILAHAPPFVA